MKMSNYPFVIRAENRDRYEHLRGMRELLHQYYNAILQLVELYSSVSCAIGNEFIYSWQVPLSAYVNFRDALFHYSAACHHEEVITLITDSSMLEEHLHRAVKDTAVFFLQQLGNKLESLWNYSRSLSPVKINTAKSHPLNIKETFYTLYKDDKLEDALGFLHDSYEDVLSSQKSVLQHWMHEIRSYDLLTRNSSMQIQKPFHPSNLRDFLLFIEQCNSELKTCGLFELVYWFADYMEIEVV